MMKYVSLKIPTLTHNLIVMLKIELYPNLLNGETVAIGGAVKTGGSFWETMLSSLEEFACAG